MTIALSLPLPPPVNNLFFNLPNRGRAKTAKYESWIRAADGAIQVQAKGQRLVSGNWICHIICDEDQRRGDIDNRTKAVIDRLVHSQLVPDDRYLDRITIEWGHIDMEVEHVPRGCRVYAWTTAEKTPDTG